MSIRLRYRLVALLIVTLVLGAAPLFAQLSTTISFTPPNPTENHVITARIRFQSPCSGIPTTTVTGTTVRTTIALIGCVIGPPPGFVTVTDQFGPLPAGTYTYEVYYDGSGPPFLGAQQQLVVMPAPAPDVPTVSGVVLLILIALVAGSGLVVLGRS